jgi:hypothetical protein
MKHLLLTTIAAVVLVGCGESQQSTPAPKTKPVELVAEAAKPEPPTTKAPYISIDELLRPAERNRRPRQLTQPV